MFGSEPNVDGFGFARRNVWLRDAKHIVGDGFSMDAIAQTRRAVVDRSENTVANTMAATWRMKTAFSFRDKIRPFRNSTIIQRCLLVCLERGRLSVVFRNESFCFCSTSRSVVMGAYLSQPVTEKVARAGSVSS